MNIRRLIPAVDWIRDYGPGPFQGDMLAALIVTIMLIPQSLAYAMLAGLPPEVGLYASILPLVAYAIFGTSRTLAVGPVAVVSLLTAAAASQVAAPGSAEYIAAALGLAFLSGIVLLAMGILRLGFIANYLSHPVISGFISASGILIAASQFKHILGVSASGHSLIEIGHSLIGQVGQINIPTFMVGGLALIFLFYVRSGLQSRLEALGLSPRVAAIMTRAGPVFAVIGTTLAVYLGDLEAQGVRIIGDIPGGLPPLSLPTFDAEWLLTLLPAALLLSLIGFVESISVAQTLAAKRRQRIDPDQELVGLGAANLAAGLTSGYPVTGGFARSVVNFDAGAETPFAGVLTAVGIALTALYLTPLFHFLPQAALAATIIVAVLSLVDLKAMIRTFQYSKADFAAMAATILVVLGVGVETGVLVGVAASIFFFLWNSSRPHMAVVGQVPGTEHFRNVRRHDVVTCEKVLTVRVDESLYFANARYLEDAIYRLVADHPKVTDVVLMCPAVNSIDASALESLEAIIERLDAAGVRFHMSEVKGPVMDKLTKVNFLDHLTGEVFLTQHAAMQELSAEATAAADASKHPPLKMANHRQAKNDKHFEEDVKG